MKTHIKPQTREDWPGHIYNDPTCGCSHCQKQPRYFAVNPLEFGGYVVRAQYDPWNAPKDTAVYRAMSHALHTAIKHEADSGEFGYDDHGSPVDQGYAFTCTAERVTL